MTPTARSSSARPGGAAAPDVQAFLAALDHPQKPALLVLREVIRRLDPTIGEEVKWNAPGFHTSTHLATFQLRHRGSVAERWSPTDRVRHSIRTR